MRGGFLEIPSERWTYRISIDPFSGLFSITGPRRKSTAVWAIRSIFSTTSSIRTSTTFVDLERALPESALNESLPESCAPSYQSNDRIVSPKRLTPVWMASSDELVKLRRIVFSPPPLA